MRNSVTMRPSRLSPRCTSISTASSGTSVLIRILVHTTTEILVFSAHWTIHFGPESVERVGHPEENEISNDRATRDMHTKISVSCAYSGNGFCRRATLGVRKDGDKTLAKVIQTALIRIKFILHLFKSIHFQLLTRSF